METERHVYHLKADSSGCVVLPSEERQRNHIAEGDTVVVVADWSGLHVKTREQIGAEAQAYFASFVPRDVLLSEEVLQDRRAEFERD